jgi:hypothetical protein
MTSPKYATPYSLTSACALSLAGDRVAFVAQVGPLPLAAGLTGVTGTPRPVSYTAGAGFCQGMLRDQVAVGGDQFGRLPLIAEGIGKVPTVGSHSQSLPCRLSDMAKTALPANVWREK